MLLLFICCMSCGNRETQVVRNESTGAALGTSYSLIYLSTEPMDLQKEIDSVLAAVNQSLSTYIPSSDISKINNGDVDVVVEADPEVIERLVDVVEGLVGERQQHAVEERKED